MKEVIYERASDLPGRPPAPGDFIQEDILDAFELTQGELATRLGVSRRSVNELIKERRSISTEMALRLSALTGQSAEYWMNLQTQYDLWKLRDQQPDFHIQPL